MSPADVAAGPHEVPAYSVDELAPKGHDYCVLVFVLNEGERIRRQVAEMAALGLDADVIIADGGSTDDGVELGHLSDNRVRALLTKRGPGKLSAQMRMGFDYALRQGYLGAVVIDGNGKDGIDAIPAMLSLLREGYDHVQGSRFIRGGRAINTPVSRWLGVRLLHSPLISLAARERHTDTTNGFRAYSARLLGDPEIAAFRNVFETYELHYHLAIEASRLKRFRTTETPVTRAYPKHGSTPTKIKGLRGNTHVLGVLFKAVSGAYRYRPGKD